MANSIYWIIVGLIITLFSSIPSGLLNLLLGVALYSKSKIAFWLVLIFELYTAGMTIFKFSQIEKTGGDISLTLVNFITLIGLVFIIMLWQQIRKEKK